VFKLFCHVPERLKEIRTCTASRIENDDLFISESTVASKFLSQEPIDLADLVADDGGWRIPNDAAPCGG
jgi:hypothetical protein